MRVRSNFLLLIAALSLLSANARATLPIAPDASTRGPFQVASGEYRFAAGIDPEVLASTATEMWAKVFYPSDLSAKHPILYFLHGNHQTCGTDTVPHHDYDCSYTRTGTCPAGMVVVRNHEGYNYLGDHLASRGYIVVSINANRGITCGSGSQPDWGLNLARGRLILKHIREWSHWSTAGGAPATLGVAPDAWVGKVDLAQVGLMGHSRGGEGARAAWNIWREPLSPWPAQIPGLEIRGIFEIGAVDGQAGRVLDADDLAWNQILPMCDGDVSDLQGRMPFERMMTKSSEVRKTPKSITMVWGANHNFFNTEWQSNDSYTCSGHDSISGPGHESPQQQAVAISTATAFFTANVGALRDESFFANFDPLNDQPAPLKLVTRVDRDHSYTMDGLFKMRVDDFDQPTGSSSASVPNQAQGVTVAHSQYDQPNRAAIEWSAAGPDQFFQTNWTPEHEGRDLTQASALDFRIARQEAMISQTATDLSVALVDAEGQLTRSVAISSYVQLLGPANSTTTYITVRIPMSEFALAPGQKIRGVRFTFDKTPAGSIYLAQVRFSLNDPNIFRDSLAGVLPPLPIVPIGNQSETQPTPLPPEPMPQTPPASSPIAAVVNVHTVARSTALQGVPAFEIAIRTEGRFPVLNALPTLVMSGHKFFVSRFAAEGRLNTLIFSVPRREIFALPPRGPMFIQYGHRQATRFWRLPDYDQARFAR